MDRALTDRAPDTTSEATANEQSLFKQLVGPNSNRSRRRVAASLQSQNTDLSTVLAIAKADQERSQASLDDPRLSADISTKHALRDAQREDARRINTSLACTAILPMIVEQRQGELTDKLRTEFARKRVNQSKSDQGTRFALDSSQWRDRATEDIASNLEIRDEIEKRVVEALWKRLDLYDHSQLTDETIKNALNIEASVDVGETEGWEIRYKSGNNDQPAPSSVLIESPRFRDVDVRYQFRTAESHEAGATASRLASETVQALSTLVPTDEEFQVGPLHDSRLRDRLMQCGDWSSIAKSARAGLETEFADFLTKFILPQRSHLKAHGQGTLSNLKIAPQASLRYDGSIEVALRWGSRDGLFDTRGTRPRDITLDEVLIGRSAVALKEKVNSQE